MDQINVTKVELALINAEKETNNYAMRKFLDRSQGKYSYKALAKRGHPYNSTHPFPLDMIPYKDSGIINMQSRNFVLSWKKNDPYRKGDSIVSRTYNDAPYADDLLNGIPGLTIPRPLMDKALPNVAYFRNRNLSVGIRNALS
jgi:hypothetical protein